ncbi:MAG: (d)CMP kinase [Erysipelotrichaceae bacterium]|nr:(d)CMP kinase [Erysipelotrichaceae bacterium]
MRFNIAIDGPSAAGKSTIAKAVAKALGLIHLDSGAMYRAIAYKAYINGIDINDEPKIKAFLLDTVIDFDSLGNVYLDHKDVSEPIRAENMSWLASSVSTLLSVREDMVRRQQEMALSKGVIMDGRDIGTVVLPDAEVKIFLTADVKSRADRRYFEQKTKGLEVSYDEIYQDIIKRDLQDTQRVHSPLKKADDAFEVDTTNLSIDEVVNEILKIIKHKIGELE